MSRLPHKIKEVSYRGHTVDIRSGPHQVLFRSYIKAPDSNIVSYTRFAYDPDEALRLAQRFIDNRINRINIEEATNGSNT